MVMHTAETFYKHPYVDAIPPAFRAAALHWTRKDVPRFIPKGLSGEHIIHAYVNHGRWIVECPSCSSAQVASRTDPRFFCSECLNGYAGQEFVAVVWPEDAEAIEAELEKRPQKTNQNWMTHETVSILRAENEHNLREDVAIDGSKSKGAK